MVYFLPCGTVVGCTHLGTVLSFFFSMCNQTEKTITVPAYYKPLISLFRNAHETHSVLQSINHLYYLPFRLDDLGADDRAALDMLVMLSDSGFDVLEGQIEEIPVVSPEWA